MKRRHSERGATLVEAALTLSLLLLVLFGIFDFGRAYHVYQISTNAAREGARYSVAPAPLTTTLPSNDQVKARVQEFLDLGAVTVPAGNITVTQADTVTINSVSMTATTVQVVTPFTFTMLPFGPINITTRATMRNETN